MAIQMKPIVDKILSGVSNGYKPKKYISELVLPQLFSAQYSGKIGAYGKGHLRIVNSVGGGNSKFRSVDPITRSSSTFLIEPHGVEGFVTDEDYRNLEDPYDAEKDMVEGLTNILYLEKEQLLGSTLGNTAIVTQNVTLAGVDQWSDYANSDPLGDVATAKETIYDATGDVPNLMVMNWSGAEKLRYHPQVLDTLGYKYAKPGGLSDDDLAAAFKVEKFLIGSAKYNSAQEGATDVLADCWGNNAILMVSPDKPDKWQVSFGYNMQLKGQQPRQVSKYIVNNPGSTGVLVKDFYDFVIVDATAAYLIKDVI